MLERLTRGSFPISRPELSNPGCRPGKAGGSPTFTLGLSRTRYGSRQRLTGSVALYGQIRQMGLQLKDSSDAYQENWRLAISDVLSNRSADYDYLELI